MLTISIFIYQAPTRRHVSIGCPNTYESSENIEIWGWFMSAPGVGARRQLRLRLAVSTQNKIRWTLLVVPVFFRHPTPDTELDQLAEDAIGLAGGFVLAATAS